MISALGNFGPVVAMMNRKAAVHWWGKDSVPPECAHVEFDPRHQRRIVTWAEVMQARREKQREQLWRRREWFVQRWRAHKLWVAYYDQNLMGGWHAFLEDYRGDGYRIWIDRDCTWLREHLITLYPLVLPLHSRDPWEKRWPAWEQWKVAFAEAFERRRHDRKPLGVAYVWWDGRKGLREATWPPERTVRQVAIAGWSK